MIAFFQKNGIAITDLFSSFRGQADARKPSRELAVHRKVILLGIWLLMCCAGVAAMGIWSIVAINRNQVKLTRREVPALALLLKTDVDLYEAQLGLERAAATDDPLQRKTGQDFFSENIAQSNEKFVNYKGLSMGAEGEAADISTYEKDRAKWTLATEELAHSFNDIQTSQPPHDASTVVTAAAASTAVPTIAQTRVLFQTMRAHLNQIVAEIYQPAIAASGDELDRLSSQTCWKLFGGAMIALAAGIVLTRSMARTLRIQEQAAESMNEEQEKQNRRQIFEARLGRGLEMARDEDAALRLIEQGITTAAPDVTTEILLADSSRAHLHQAVRTGQQQPGCGCDVPKPSDCPAVRRGHRLHFESGTLLDACPHLRNRPGGDRSAVCIPLSIMGQAVGVLHMTAPHGQLPPEEQIQALEHLASKSGERLGLLRAFRKSEAQAQSDPLTGLLNRRSLEESVHELTRQQIPFALAYGDLDHFKNLNDTHGHETGDKALRMFAQVLKASIRPGDLASRWGGEEFVLVLPRATADEGVAALDRVRQTLAKALQGADTPTFTVSFGVAQTAAGALFVDVLARADASLLRAKKEGRNRTIKSPEIVPASSPEISTGDELTDGTDTSAPPTAAAA